MYICGLLAVRRSGQRDDAEHAGAHALGDGADRAALAGGVAALEDHDHAQPLVLHPRLELAQLALELAEGLSRTSSASACRRLAASSRSTVFGSVLSHRWTFPSFSRFVARTDSFQMRRGARHSLTVRAPSLSADTNPAPPTPNHQATMRSRRTTAKRAITRNRSLDRCPGRRTGRRTARRPRREPAAARRP